MCNCCDACRARGASEAKNVAATQLGKALGGVRIDGGTPNERFACAIEIAQAAYGFSKDKALGGGSRYPPLRTKRSSRR